MKTSEFRKLIREEVKRVVNEAYSIPPTVSGSDFDKAVKEIIADIEKQIKDGVSTAINIINYPQPGSPIGPVLQYDKKTLNAYLNKFAYYQSLRTYVVNYLTEKDPKQKKDYEGFIRRELAKYWKK